MSILTVSVTAGSAQAAGARRYALVIGANVGAGSDEILRYAIDDAERVRDTLVELGGFNDADVVLLREPNADRVRAELAHMNARIREEAPGGQSMLMVYYSGHADAKTVHLSGTHIPWGEFRDLASSSAAQARVMVIDACRSGQATRVKGIKAEPFDPSLVEHLPEGFAIMTSAAAGESAQESDRLRSSFFTHHFVVGLRGMADTNRDSRVTLNEAFDYAAERTVSSSATTFAGIQHPTYKTQMKGRSDIRLTDISDPGTFGRLKMSRPGYYLVRAGDEQGPVRFEFPIEAGSSRTLHVPPGAYFVQRRTRRAYYESTIEARPGAEKALDQQPETRLAYAALTRKGGGGPVQAVWATTAGGSAPLDKYRTRWGLGLGYSFERRAWSWDARVLYNRSVARGTGLPATLDRIHLDMGPRFGLDMGPFAFFIGLRAGFWASRQEFEAPNNNAPTRNNLGMSFAGTFRTELSIIDRLYLLGEVDMGVLVGPNVDADEGPLRLTPNVVAHLGFGLRF